MSITSPLHAVFPPLDAGALEHRATGDLPISVSPVLSPAHEFVVSNPTITFFTSLRVASGEALFGHGSACFRPPGVFFTRQASAMRSTSYPPRGVTYRAFFICHLYAEGLS